MTELNLAQLHETVAAEVPQRECIVQGPRRLTYGQVTQRTRRLARFLAARGLGLHTERRELENHASGQDHVALYMYNCPEYLEAMLGCFKARAVPFNVNYRYVQEELRYLLRDADARAIVYHGELAPMVARLRPQLPGLRLLIQVDDGSGAELLPGAVSYEAALASAPAEKPLPAWSGDDLYTADGAVEVLGRDSVTINSGGEKIFAEEVEAALKRHPDVYDAIVCGRPSPRWGQVVCAVVQLRRDAGADAAALLEEAEKHLARYKLPKAFRLVERIVRSPSGKPDYRWARAQLGGE